MIRFIENLGNYLPSFELVYLASLKFGLPVAAIVFLVWLVTRPAPAFLKSVEDFEYKKVGFPPDQRVVLARVMVDGQWYKLDDSPPPYCDSCCCRPGEQCNICRGFV